MLKKGQTSFTDAAKVAQIMLDSVDDKRYTSEVVACAAQLILDFMRVNYGVIVASSAVNMLKSNIYDKQN